MALGFASPSILFLNTWDAPERSFCKKVFEGLPARGYTRYVEPCSGAFAMPFVAHAAGWDPAVMEASDSSLFSSIVGAMLSGTDYDALGMRLDGDPVTFPDRKYDRVQQAAYLLYVQLLARTQARPMTVEYWRYLVNDLIVREEEHVEAIAAKLYSYQERLGGMTYEPIDMWSHMKRVMDDSHTVVSINPPTYKAGFERFFDTKGRLEWNVPDYEIFDPMVDIPRLVEMFEGKKALLLCQQQRDPGDSAHPRPVFARHLSLGQYVYLNSNRPDEIFDITGGPKVALKRKGPDLVPADLPLLPVDHPITEDSTVQCVPIAPNVADYYRGLWMHRLNAQPGGMNVLVVVDGFAAGVIGYSTSTMTFAYAPKWSRHLLLRFAFGAPHETLRTTRLVTMLALRRKTIDLWLTPANAAPLACSEGLVTVEITRHPEIKGLRGLMKLADRQKHPDGHKLVYGANWNHDDPPTILRTFLNKEKQWQRNSTKQQQKTPTSKTRQKSSK